MLTNKFSLKSLSLKIAVAFCICILAMLAGCIATGNKSANVQARNFVINPISNEKIESFYDLEKLGIQLRLSSQTGSMWSFLSGWGSEKVPAAFPNIDIGTTQGSFFHTGMNKRLTETYLRYSAPIYGKNNESSQLYESNYVLLYPEAMSEDRDFGYETYMAQSEFDFLVYITKLFLANPDNPFALCVPEKLARIAAENNCYFAIETAEHAGEADKLFIISRNYTYDAEAIAHDVREAIGKSKSIYIESLQPIGVSGIYNDDFVITMNWANSQIMGDPRYDGYENEYFDGYTLYWHLSDEYISNVIEPAIKSMAEG